MRACFNPCMLDTFGACLPVFPSAVYVHKKAGKPTIIINNVACNTRCLFTKNKLSRVASFRYRLLQYSQAVRVCVRAYVFLCVRACVCVCVCLSQCVLFRKCFNVNICMCIQWVRACACILDVYVCVCVFV